MCGRFTLRTPPALLASLFDLPQEPDVLAPRYNIAPTQPVLIVRLNARTQRRESTHVRWGLIPSWAKDPTIGARMINARSETVAEKPSFRAPFKRRRCLVPSDGFYEWKKEGKRKQPYFITVDADSDTKNASDRPTSDANPFAIAALWEHWEGADGSVLETCTLLTTEANELMKPLHHRMPVILDPEDYEMWLHHDEDPIYLSNLRHLMRPFPSEQMSVRAVSTYVNNARNEGPECVEPL